MAEAILEQPQSFIEVLMEQDPNIHGNINADSMKAYIRRYFSDFPIEINDRRLQRTLVNVLQKAYYTTFIEDYDLNESGIGLDALVDFPKEIVEVCLDHLVYHSTTFFIPEYVRRYREGQS